MDQIIAIQPRPTLAQVAKLGNFTAIARTWNDGDTQRCRLCPECTARDGLCLVLVESMVDIPARDVPLYSLSNATGRSRLRVDSRLAGVNGATH